MESDQRMSRPPFDEHGYAMWDTQDTYIERRKKTPRWWLIPAGLLVIALIVGVVWILKPKKTTEELCHEALADALRDMLGYEEPLANELRIADLVELVQSKQFTGETSIALEDANVNLEGTTLEDWLTDKGLPLDLSMLSGIGIVADTAVNGSQSHSRLRLSYSGIRMTAAELFTDAEALYLTSPKLFDAVLRIEPDRVRDEWETSPLWGALSENQAKSFKNLLAKGEDLFVAVGEELDGAKEIFGAAFDTSGEFMDRLLSCYTYEKATDEEGNEITEKFPVGKRMASCKAYIIRGDAVALSDLLCRAFGVETGTVRVLGQTDEQPEATLYLTKAGELIRMEASCVLAIGERSYPFSIELQCSGEDDPQHNVVLRAAVGLETTDILLELKKNTKVNRTEIESRINGDLVITTKETGETESYGIVFLAEYDRLADTMDLTVNTYWDDRTVGALETRGTFSWEDGACEIRFPSIRFRDTFNGNEGVVSWDVSLAPYDEEPELPKENVLDVFEMSQDEVAAWKEDLIKNLKWYLSVLSDFTG